MEQGVMSTFKAYYLRRTFKQLIEFTDGENRPTAREFWRAYHIMKAIDNLSVAWQEVKTNKYEPCLEKNLTGVYWRLPCI